MIIAQATPEEIQEYLKEIILLTGNRPPTEAQRDAITDFMQKYMGTVKLEDIKTAFEWSIAGRLGREHERKQAFTMPVIKEVWDTYNKKSTVRYNKPYQQQPEAQSRYMDFFKEGDKFLAYHPMQNKEKVKAEFVGFLRYLTKQLNEFLDNKSTPIISTSFVYDILNKCGVIELDKKDWGEINEAQFNPRNGVVEKVESVDPKPINSKALKYWLKYKFTPNHLVEFKKGVAEACRKNDYLSDAIYFETIR